MSSQQLRKTRVRQDIVLDDADECVQMQIHLHLFAVVIIVWITLCD